MLRYLRIAVTALSLSACALLVALWLRSYWRADQVSIKVSSRWLYANSSMGSVELGFPGPLDWNAPNEWTWISVAINELHTHFGFALTHYGGMIVPHWFLTILAAAMAGVPWIHWHCRSSLRTLLIATTQVAVGLGVMISLR